MTSLTDALKDAQKRLEEVFPKTAPDTTDRHRYFCLAAAMLYDQNRIDDVIAHATGPRGLLHHELLWTALFSYLQSCGYALDERYAPGWRPLAADGTRKGFLSRSLDTTTARLWGRDAVGEPLPPTHYRTMRATNVSTGHRVYLKIVISSPEDPHGQERDILQLLNSEPHRSHRDNPCVPVYEFLSFPAVPGASPGIVPCLSIAVMPELQPLSYERLPIKALYLDVIEQSLRGLAYLHSLGIAHRDLCDCNLALSPGKPPYRLYFLDFGLAKQFQVTDPPTASALWQGGRMQVPEVTELNKPYDPYKADLYMLADEFWELSLSFLPELPGLAQIMASENPAERSTATEAMKAYVGTPT
ncbi:hypothetical protein EXIGLDRAFT_776012 [Exidia glandulosa HHB12029]|uniref:Protein kinase domain-containing protein n=1 Tax=Exidia glandulosa HHB12029 TaxID=1314781 RepID=A0A165DN86_EXIGL|nr:hypothetical protein EXIGLDRAFT_776012 [Exidia glandulosa HHB12029]